MNITIRLAKPEDAPDMAEVLARSWEIAYKDIIPMEYIKAKNATRSDQFARIITHDNKTQHVVQADNKTMGIMNVAPPQDDDVSDEFYELHGLYLHPEYYRMGIGTQTMNFAIDVARNLGKKYMTLWVFAENRNSINFYTKCGYAPDGKTKSIDCGKRMECIRMRKQITVAK